MSGFDTMRGILVGILLIAVGWVMANSGTGIKLLTDIGWIFLFGGIAVVALSIYSTVRG